MVGSTSSNFYDVMTIGERIENGMKTGKIVSIANQQGVSKKPQGSLAKKKERVTSDVIENDHPQFQAFMALMPYYPYPYISAA